MTMAILEAFVTASDKACAADRLHERRTQGATTLTIKGAPFTFRTFPDGEFGKGRGADMRDGERTLDRLVTVTLPAIAGEDHKMVPTMEVNL